MCNKFKNAIIISQPFIVDDYDLSLALLVYDALLGFE
jgi:hypothetical protein